MKDILTFKVRTVAASLSRRPRFGTEPPVSESMGSMRTVESGHFDAYPCPGCGAWLLTRAARAAVREYGISCPRCPVSGLIASRAEDTVIPGFNHVPDGDIATHENGASMSAKTQPKKRGFRGTAQRGGRPRLSEEERRRKARERKRQQRGISAPAQS